MFVGDLAPDVTDYTLQEHFRHFFASVRSAKASLSCPQLVGLSRWWPLLSVALHRRALLQYAVHELW